MSVDELCLKGNYTTLVESYVEHNHVDYSIAFICGLLVSTLAGFCYKFRRWFAKSKDKLYSYALPCKRESQEQHTNTFELRRTTNTESIGSSEASESQFR